MIGRRLLGAEISWGKWTRDVLTPITVVGGIVGNIITFIVMKSPPLRHKSYSHFLCALALFDSLTLIGRQVTMINEFQHYKNKPGIFLHFNDVGCKVYYFSKSVCYLMSSWLIVFMAIERLVVVQFPLLRRRLCTSHKAILFVVCLFVIVSCTQLFRFVMIARTTGGCGSTEEYLMLYTAIHTYFYQFCLIFALPVGAILTCNVLVLRRVCLSRRFRRSDAARRSMSASRRISSHKATFTLLVICAVYIITLLPSVVVSIVIHIAISINVQTAGPLVMAIMPYSGVIEVISNLNYGCNFFIYIASGKIFRKQFWRIFRCEKN